MYKTSKWSKYNIWRVIIKWIRVPVTTRDLVSSQVSVPAPPSATDRPPPSRSNHCGFLWWSLLAQSLHRCNTHACVNSVFLSWDPPHKGGTCAQQMSWCRPLRRGWPVPRPAGPPPRWEHLLMYPALPAPALGKYSSAGYLGEHIHTFWHFT